MPPTPNFDPTSHAATPVTSVVMPHRQDLRSRPNNLVHASNSQGYVRRQNLSGTRAMSSRTKAVSTTAIFLILCAASPFLPSFVATVLTTTCVVLIGGVCFRAIFASGTVRAFSVGFLLTSLIYISATIAVGDFTLKHLGHKVPTTQVLQSFVRPAISNPPVVQLVGPEARLRSAHGNSFIPLGHLLFAIGLGAISGVYANRLSGKAAVEPRNLAQNAVA